MMISFSGASGMVGGSLGTRLSGTEHEAMPLSTSLPANVGRRCPDLHTGSRAQWEEALAGVDAYVHLAALLPFDASNKDDEAWPKFRQANVDAPALALEALAAAGGTRFVFVSTIAMHGVVSGAKRFSLDDPVVISGNYGRSKVEAEKVLASKATDLGIELVVIRPPIVYGPGIRGKFGSLIGQIAKGRPIPVGSTPNSRDMIGATNLADILIEACVNPAMAGSTYLVCDRDPISTEALVRLIGSELGVKPRVVPIPKLVSTIAARVPVVSGLMERLVGDVRIDDAPLEADSAWSPALTTSDEVALMIESWERS